METPTHSKRSDPFPTLFYYEELSNILFSHRWGLSELEESGKILRALFSPSGIMIDLDEGL